MKLHSQIVGQGQPMIILHGFLGMGDNWRSLALALAKRNFQVHLVDQRNHGRSFHDFEFNYEVLTQDLYNYFQEKDLDRAIVLGHSMGGKTAMAFATQHPEMVTHLAIADIGPKAYPPHHQSILKALDHLQKGKPQSRKQADALVAEYVKEPGIRQFLLKNLHWTQDRELALRLNLNALIEHSDQIGAALDQDAHYSGPSLFLKGAKSDYLLPEDGPLIAHHFPQASLIEIPGAGHWLHAENPSDFLQALIDFLRPT